MDEIECKVLPNSKALRDAIICVGWLKFASIRAQWPIPNLNSLHWSTAGRRPPPDKRLIGVYLRASVLWYMLLFFLTTAKSRGEMSYALRYMLIAAAPLQIANALLLFYCALEGRLVAVEVCLWLCLALGAYNLVLGLVGCVYFIRIGQEDMHFVLATLYLLLSLSVFTVLCHDVLVLYAFKQVLFCASKVTPCAD